MIQDIKYDLWNYLKNSHKKIILYGMGNGADKILSVCEQRGIEVSDFFASDGFVRGHSFHGKTVLTFSAVKEKYGVQNIIVLVSFGTNRPEVLDNIYKIAAECELYAPDVPVFGDNLFDAEFYKNLGEQFDTAREMFSDEKSKRIFDDIIRYKLSGDIKYLTPTEVDKSVIYKEILRSERFESIADLGAYNGDTIREILSYAPNLKSVIAFEPDAHSFKKLNEYSSSQVTVQIKTVNACAWDKNTELVFDASGNRNSGVFENTSSVIADRAANLKILAAKSLDSVADERLDYIKYDVEGSEQKALEGSKQVILRCSPALLVSAYHRSEDLAVLPPLIMKLNGNYRLYLRRTSYIPAWDIHILAVAD